MLSQSLVFNFQLNRAGSSLGFRNSHCDFNCVNRITRKTIQWNTMLSQSCFEVSTQRSRAKETTPAWVSSRYKDTKEYLTLWVTAIIVNRARQKKTTQGTLQDLQTPRNIWHCFNRIKRTTTMSQSCFETSRQSMRKETLQLGFQELNLDKLTSRNISSFLFLNRITGHNAYNIYT